MKTKMKLKLKIQNEKCATRVQFSGKTELGVKGGRL